MWRVGAILCYFMIWVFTQWFLHNDFSTKETYYNSNVYKNKILSIYIALWYVIIYMLTYNICYMLINVSYNFPILQNFNARINHMGDLWWPE